MENASEQAEQSGFRYRIGVWMFIIGNTVTFSSALVVPALGLPLAWIPALVLGGELFAIGSIPIIGMKGFKALKNKMLSFFRLPPVEELKPVSRLRHVCGLVLFGVGVILPWLGALFIFQGYQEATSEDPFPEIWGVPYDQQLDTFLTFVIGSEVCFLIGVFMLGGLWWERTRYVFAWPGHEFDSKLK